MEQRTVTVEPRGAVSVVRMDDGKANALSDQLLDELGAALDAIEQRGDAVVLAGRPGRFSAGFDLKVMMSSVDAAKRLVASGAKLLMRLYTFPRPVVIACTGHGADPGGGAVGGPGRRVGYQAGGRV